MERIDRLRERNAALAAAHEAAREELDRALERVRSAGERAQEAKRRVEEAEKMHARSMARVGGSDTGGLEDAEGVLARARATSEAAEADRARAAAAVEELMERVESARRELTEGATRAKVEIVEGLLVDARDAWTVVRERLDELAAIRTVPEGENPPVTGFVGEEADEFERRVFERRGEEPKRGVPRTARRFGLIGLVVLTIAGAGAVAAGGVLEWIEGRSGLDLSYRAFYGADLGRPLLQPSAGVIAILIGVVGLGGLVAKTAWLPRLAGALAVVAAALFLGNASRLESLSSVETGVWVALGGGIALLVGGLTGSFRSPPEEA